MFELFRRPLVRIAGLCVLFCTLLGCFEVREEITIHKNRSGTYRLVIDLGEMAGMMQSAGESMGEALGGEGEPAEDDAKKSAVGPAAEMDEDMAEKLEVLGGVKGLSKVAAVNDGGQVGFSFVFSDLAALNAALDKLAADENEQNGESPFSFSRRSITRGKAIGLGFDSGTGEGPGETEMMAAMNPTYTFVLTVPRKIRKVANEAGVNLSVSGNTLTVTASMSDILAGQIDLSNEILYR